MNNPIIDKKESLIKNKFKFINKDYPQLSKINLNTPKNRYKDNLKHQLKENKLSVFAITVLVFVFISSIFAFLSPYDPNKININERLCSPCLKHLCGTDELGRDYLTRMLYGGRVSLSVGFSSMIMSIVIGTIIGTISGFIGGLIDKIIMRFLDILMCIPTFFLILIINAYTTPSLKNVIIIIGLTSWMGIARIVRSETLVYKEKEYVMASHSLGASNFHIIKKHIIPNVMPTIIVSSSIDIADAIITESALSFLGLGIQAPKASWGSMLQTAQSYLSQASYMALFPGILILLTVLSFNILGDVLRIALEPKLYTKS